MSEADMRCDDCGRFMNPEHSGASTAIIYDFAAMEPSYEHLRCPPCSARLGPIHSNATPYNGDMSRYETHVE